MKKLGGSKLFWGVVALCLVLAGALPGIANAYWACTSINDGSCYTWESCIEYNDCTDQATGRRKMTLYMDIC